MTHVDASPSPSREALAGWVLSRRGLRTPHLLVYPTSEHSGGAERLRRWIDQPEEFVEHARVRLTDLGGENALATITDVVSAPLGAVALVDRAWTTAARWHGLVVVWVSRTTGPVALEGAALAVHLQHLNDVGDDAVPLVLRLEHQGLPMRQRNRRPSSLR